MIEEVLESGKEHGMARLLSYVLGILMTRTNDGHLVDAILWEHGQGTPL